MFMQFSLKQNVVALSFLMIGLVLSGCAGLLGSHENVNYKPKLKQSVSKRSQLPTISSASPNKLRDDKYVEIGTLSISRETKKCWSGSQCDIYSHTGTATDQLLKEAAERGADVVTLSNNNFNRTQSLSRNGKCLFTKKECTSRLVPTYQTHCSPRVGGSVSCSQRQSGTKMQNNCSNVCTSYELIQGTLYSQFSNGTLWRKDPQLAQRIYPNRDLFNAIEWNKPARVQELLNDGANPNGRDKDGFTPLGVATKKGHLDVVKELIARGADINAKASNGYTALFYAARNGDLDIVKELIAKGADVNAKDKYGVTILISTVYKRRLAIVKELVTHGADVNAKNKSGKTALYQAADNEDLDIMKVLMDSGARVNKKYFMVNNLLHTLAAKGRWDIIILLSTRGMDINGKTLAGSTVLYVAVRNGKLDIVKKLIKAGAEVNTKSNQGITALDIAKQKGHNKIVDFLKKHGAK